MATVKILFDGGNVPVLMGSKPSSPTMPLEDPIPAGGMTNLSFLAAPGVYFFGLDTPIPHRPLWQRGRAINSVPLQLTFSTITNEREMG